uniref:Uncharacterized protein n=1 Tax=Candidatus Kentrum sp. TC TaxID=2126339 RepID=A0A450YLW3_9GAMM|nr:MAG: hypothetical protein BECKTC1821E_GA0114239_101941 [Candidatus Kentron sp. TC]VFK52245.1 MAG: hypothetical protein BECKTC1821D_GA0114238_11606 [Candidatus Kentron sp. TC]
MKKIRKMLLATLAMIAPMLVITGAASMVPHDGIGQLFHGVPAWWDV